MASIIRLLQQAPMMPRNAMMSMIIPMTMRQIANGSTSDLTSMSSLQS